jgi:hypothetical protein
MNRTGWGQTLSAGQRRALQCVALLGGPHVAATPPPVPWLRGRPLRGLVTQSFYSSRTGVAPPPEATVLGDTLSLRAAGRSDSPMR